MANHAEVCARYIQAMRWSNVRRISSRSVFFEGNTLYSYGRHFPLAEYYPAGKHGRTAPLMLLNGDRNSVTTARHQADIRSAVHGLTTWPELQVIILPFSALDAAGINRRTIRPLEVRPDRWDYWTESVPGDFNAIQWGPMPVADPERRHNATSQTGAIPGGNGAHAIRYLRHWDYGANLYVERDPETAPVSFYTASGSGINVDTDGNGTVERSRHWLGDSLFTAEVMVTRRRTVERTAADVVRYARAAVRSPNAVELIEDWPLTAVETYRVAKRRKFISSFDYQEPGNLYFLATMPNGRAKTVDDAILELAPRAVHAAMARGIDVERQGDIFAIATPLTDSEVYGRAVSRARRTQWTDNALPRKGEIGTVDVARRHRHAVADGKAIRRRYHALRTMQWATWDSMRSKPRKLRDRAMGLPRTRYQRHTFTHAKTAFDDATRATMAKYEPSRERVRRDLRTALAIHGTAHTATEVVRTRGGATYVRGIMYHEPSLEPGRNGDRDHVRRPLGDRSTWYLALRNTVPRAS